jgi:hypothetical protein
LHLALPPIAFCISGEGQIGLQKAGIGLPRFFPRLLRITPQVVAGGGVGGVFDGGVALIVRGRTSPPPVARAKLSIMHYD